MTRETPGAAEAPIHCRRVLGQVRGESPGPTMMAMAAVHGNELAGIRAAERLLDRVEPSRLRGRVIFLAGNLAAIKEHTRFIAADLNRIWTSTNVSRVLARGGSRDPVIEDKEQLELIETIGELLDGAPEPIYFLDMHTSSAPGPPFVTVGDTLRNRRFALRFSLPIILGLEEQIDGSLLEYLNNCGFITVGVEAGQHDRGESVDRLESILWQALIGAGMLDAADVPERTCHQQRLASAVSGIPRVIEVRHRHAIAPEDHFRMERGFENFMKVEKGRLLGHDAHGLILAPARGLILLPLYQGKGDDGFFIAREVRPFWLRVSGVLRRLRAASLLRLLPGVRRHPTEFGALVVETRLARLYPLEIFHLLGFRRLRRTGTQLLVARRRYDLVEPTQVRFPLEHGPV